MKGAPKMEKSKKKTKLSNQVCLNMGCNCNGDKYDAAVFVVSNV